MNITKFLGIFALSFFLTGCTICPWRTMSFMSFPSDKLYEIDKMNIHIDENDINMDTDCIIEDVFFYFCSNGTEDTMYSTKGPFALNFVFESFSKDTVITINSIEMKFDGKYADVDNALFPVSITINSPSFPNPELYSGSYKTDYVYELNKVKKISVIVNATIIKDGVEVTKDLNASAIKEVKTGVFQYRF